MSMRKVGSIEIYTLDENIDQYTRKEREKFINELFKNEYQGKEISYLLNGDEINALINTTTRKNFKAYQHSGKFEKKRAFHTRQDIAFSGDYLDLVSNGKYDYSTVEKKQGQNEYHKNANKWHYFEKMIRCNDYYFNVIVDVLESENEFYVYNTKLKEVDAPDFGRGEISTSSMDNIPQKNEKIKNGERHLCSGLDTQIQDAQMKVTNDKNGNFQSIKKKCVEVNKGKKSHEKSRDMEK